MGVLLSVEALSSVQLQHCQEPEHAPLSLPDEPFSALATTSILARFPVEILLLISSFLTPESAISLSLISKYYYTILSPRIDLSLSQNARAKRRLLRLLEVDWPDMMACHACNILYHWKTRPLRYNCGEYTRQFQSHFTGLGLCYDYPHIRMQYSVVQAYLRGYEMGPAYGPPLSDLTHSCQGRLTGDKKKNTRHSVQARVVGGKLMLHRTLNTPIYLLDSIALQLDNFQLFGCRHSFGTLPAVIMDAIEHREEIEHPSIERPCLGFINCAQCATDLRVQIEPQNAENINVRVEMWHFLGGRDLEQQDPMVQAMFDRSYQEFNLRTPPARKLELLYNEEAPDRGLSPLGPEPQCSSQRTWLQLWDWHLFSDGYLVYEVPSRDAHEAT